MSYNLLLSAVACYALYRVSKFFVITWRVPLGYALLGICLAVAYIYGAFPLWLEVVLGIGLFIALYRLLSSLSSFYVSKPILTHSIVFGAVYGALSVNWNSFFSFTEKLM